MKLTEEIKREIGQHFVFGFHGHEVSEDIKTLIQTYHLGSVILMKRNVQSIPQVRKIVTELQQLARDSGHGKPLMIGIDQENGLVSAFSSTVKHEAGTQFPGAMALSATGTPEGAYAASNATGKEMKAVGINWAYSPVADINSNSRNPVIGVRSFSDDPTEVATYSRAVSRGLTEAGIAPSAKHFPGHGDTDVDSHLGLPVIPKSASALAATELVPFRALVEDGIASIMTAHIALPGITGDEGVPASLSRKINTDLLRDELGYGGIIVTDCLEMDGVRKTWGAEGGAVMALAAGADIVMICHRMPLHVGALEAAYAAVESEELSLEALRKSGQRIAQFKDTFAGTWDDALGTSPAAIAAMKAFDTLKHDHAALSKDLYARSVALIPPPTRDDTRGVLPFSPGEPVLLFTPQMESVNLAVDDAEGVLRTSDGRPRNTAGPSYLAFARSISTRTPTSAEHIVYGSEGLSDEAATLLSKATQIVFTLRNADLSPWQMDVLRAVMNLRTANGKVVVVSSCAPYDGLRLSKEDIDAPCIATFEFTPPAFEAATAVLFGESEARGRIPVKI